MWYHTAGNFRGALGEVEDHIADFEESLVVPSLEKAFCLMNYLLGYSHVNRRENCR